MGHAGEERRCVKVPSGIRQSGEGMGMETETETEAGEGEDL